MEQAMYDIQAAKMSLDNKFYEWAAFQSVQAAEKALKAVLVHSGWRAPKMHRLSVLMGLGNEANPEFKKTKFKFRELETYTFISRYPFALPGKNQSPHKFITEKDANKAYHYAQDILEKVNKLLKVEIKGKQKKVEQHLSKEQLESRIKEVTEILKKEFNPEKIILFGSFAKKGMEDKDEFTTMDIMIIADSKLPFIDRIREARMVTKGGIPAIEPLVYTPEEFRIMTEEEGEGFLEEAVEKGRVLYEKR